MPAKKIGYKPLRDGLEQAGVNPDDCVFAGCDPATLGFTAAYLEKLGAWWDAEFGRAKYQAITGCSNFPPKTWPPKCVCGVCIQKHYYIYDNTPDVVVTIGCVCIGHWKKDGRQTILDSNPKLKRCPACHQRNRARSKHCAMCRGPRMTCGTHEGKYFRDIYVDSPGLIWYCRKTGRDGPYTEYCAYVDALEAEKK